MPRAGDDDGVERQDDEYFRRAEELEREFVGEERVDHPCLEQARAHAATLARRPQDPAELVYVEVGATFPATLLPDLDGDGTCDLELTPTGGRWNKVWPHLIYTSRACAFAGSLLDSELAVMDTETRGHRDIEACSSLSCAGWEFDWHRYEWDGHSYGIAETRSCCFCADQESCSAANGPECAVFQGRIPMLPGTRGGCATAD